MTPSTQKQVQQPMVVRYVQAANTGIHLQNFTRNCIGYVVQGRKYIYTGDVRQEVRPGELYCFDAGPYYTEEASPDGKPYEEIVFYYHPAQMVGALSYLGASGHLDFSNRHSCTECRGKSYVVAHANALLRHFFSSVRQYLSESLFIDDKISEDLKFTELVYLILNLEPCCLHCKILEHSDHDKESFERIILGSIFSDTSIESLAAKCNRSPSSFKKDFKRMFNKPPHRWFTEQRLQHSRLLLMSTSKPVSEVGSECHFPNTSHFIKLFKKEYGVTPARYRDNAGS